MAKQTESGHPKTLKSPGKLIAIDETLDQTRLNPPARLKLAEIRAFVDATQAKHDASLNSVAKLSNDRRERNKFFYLDEDCICEIARQFKALVGGSYGFKSPEYKAVNAIPFRKPKF